MVKRKGVAIAVTAAVAAAIAGAVVVHEVAEYFGYRRPHEMLLPGLRGPGGWNQSDAQTGDLDGAVVRGWRAGATQFTETAYGYHSTWAAKRDYASSSPEKMRPDQYRGARPDDIGARATGADQAEFTCGEWEKGQCTAWWAWLRYGTVNVCLYRYRIPGDPRALTDAELAICWAPATRLNAKYDLPPLLLVVCQDPGTARWARAPYNVGPPEWDTLTVRPLVLGPDNMPVILDPAAAAHDIPMAAFSAITHSNSPQADTMLEALATALKTVDEDTIAVFGELTELGLGTSPAAETWRKLMAIPTSYFRSETSQRLRDEGRVEGRAEGRVEGRVEGRAEDVLFVLRARAVVTDDVTRARIEECTDPDVLQTWLGRALTVERAEDIFEAPAEG